MKRGLFSIILTLLYVSAVYLPSSFAQDAPQGQLFEYPEFVEISLSGRVMDVQYSPDGTKLAITSTRRILLYDAQTGKELDLFTGHSDDVFSVAFSPDGTTLASGSEDKRVRLWDVSTGKQLQALWGHSDDVFSVAFSPDGTTLASGSRDATIKLWDVSTGEQLQTLTGHTSWVRSVGFSPDGTTLASGSRDATIKLWDVSTGKQLRTLTKHTSDIYSVAFSPDGTTLASGSKDKTVRLWDVSTGKQLQILTGHTAQVYSVSFSPDGTTLASGSWDRTIKLWDVSTRTQLQTLTGHSDDVFSVVFSPDSSTLASGSEDDTVRLWDIGTGKQLQTLIGDSAGVRSVAFSADGSLLASGSWDETVRLWDVSTGKQLRTLTRHTSAVSSVAFSPDGRTLASGSANGTIKLWDVSTKRELQSLKRHRYDVYSVVFSPDSSTLASGGSDSTVRLWDVSTGEQLQTLAGHTSAVYSVAFSPDGSTLASGSWDDTIRLWDVSTGEQLQTLIGDSDGIRSVAFSPDGSTLASGSRNDTIWLWDVSTGKQFRLLRGHWRSVYSIAFSPDGSMLASGSDDTTIKLWDVSTGKQLQTLTGHSNSVYSVAFSPDGSTLASGSEDWTVLLWELTLPPSDNEVLDDHSNTRAKATPLSFGHDGALTGIIDLNNDVDYFALEISEPGGVLALYTFGGRNAIIELEDSTGAVLPADDDIQYGIEDSRLRHNVSAGTYYVKITGTKENSTEWYRLRAHFTPKSLETSDHSDTRDDATPLSFGDHWSVDGTAGEINPGTDVDYFSVKIDKTGELTVYSIGWIDTPLDLAARLEDSKGNHLTTSTNDGDGPNFRIVYNVTPGTYYVKVTELNRDNTGDYSVYAYFTAFEDSVAYPYLKGPALEEAVRSVVYSPSGDVLIAGDNANKIHVWHPITGDKITTLEAKNYGEGKDYGDVRSIAFSPDGNWCAAGTAWQKRIIGDDGGYLVVWKRLADTWAEADAWGKPQEIQLNETVRSVAFSPDNSFLTCGTDGHKVYISNYLSGAQKWNDTIDRVRKLNHPDNVTSIAWHPNPTMDPNLYLLATGCDDGRVRVWDLTTSDDVTELFALDKEVHYIAFSPDGKRLSAGHNDGSIILWSDHATDEHWASPWPAAFEGKHDGAVLSLAFHPDGNVLVSCGDDRTLSFWDVHTLTSLSGVSQVEHAKISSIAFNPLGNALAIGTEGDAQILDVLGSEVHPRVYQFEYTGTTGFTNRGNFGLDIPSTLVSEVAYNENATYFILNLQFPKLIEGRVENPIYGDCIITLDLPDVQQAPVSDPNDSRLKNPLYFMYSLETPRQRIVALRADTSGESGFDIITSSIGSGVGGAIGFAIGAVLPGAGKLFGKSFHYQLAARSIGSRAGNRIGVGLRKLGKKEPTKEEMILAETADPFFLIQPTEDTVLEAETGRPRLDRYRVLFLIEKEITEIGITVEQAYQLKEEGPLYVAKSTHIWNLKGGFGSAPRAQPIALSNYPPFQELPPAEQAYLLRHFGAARNVNAEQLRIPETTTLLPNYPNPFNPETWIPYQLAKPANVTLTIYDINGHVVRELDLGHQRAGVYQSRKRAAYWDGRNTVGEPVASGVYFYALTAGDFTATRKMLIWK